MNERLIYVRIPAGDIWDQGDFTSEVCGSGRPSAQRLRNGDLMVRVGTVTEVQHAIDNPHDIVVHAPAPEGT